MERSREGQTRLKSVELAGPSWKGPGAQLRRGDVALPDGSWREIREMLDRGRFWELAPSEAWRGWDGSAWFVEVRRDAAYHVVLRMNPVDGPVFDVANALLKAAGFD
jgi:hypothetical protein